MASVANPSFLCSCQCCALEIGPKEVARHMKKVNITKVYVIVLYVRERLAKREIWHSADCHNCQCLVSFIVLISELE